MLTPYKFNVIKSSKILIDLDMIRNASKQPNIESKTFDINMSYTDI